MPNGDGTGPRNGFGRGRGKGIGRRRGFCRTDREENNNDFCDGTRRHLRRNNS